MPKSVSSKRTHLFFVCFLALLDINECERDPCKNGGICTDLVANYSCECPGEYMGRNCQYSKCTFFFPYSALTSDEIFQRLHKFIKSLFTFLNCWRCFIISLYYYHTFFVTQLILICSQQYPDLLNMPIRKLDITSSRLIVNKGD